ncbi:DegT/DnrJ/EryC1/StrS family aminotransferase [Niveispirillum sp. KHB5.9]|uniref:DegT/DnrJ/EryC1/StrS family aminotransferase n=1 Tax=Niveispirillum sp. KHB5.9 TaxID=3400269 RepID=UPI003A8AA874
MDLPIPQTDPGAACQAMRAEIDKAIARVLTSGRYILGEEVDAFEREFASWLGTDGAVGVASGTDALVLGLKALGVGAGDWVATVSHTAVATVAAIEQTGARPVLVDIDRGYGMDMDHLDATLRLFPVKVVVPVHLYGQPVALDRLQQFTRDRGIAVLEDCSQAHGARFAGRPVGRFGALAAYSLYPTKNLGGIGDGGVIAMDDAGLARTLRALRQYGWDETRSSRQPGYNSRLDEIQAAILRVRLPRLEADNTRRRAIAAAYDAGLVDVPGLALPWRRPETEHVFHQYVVAHPARDMVQTRLRDRGVLTSIHYPCPVHSQPAYRDRVALGPGGLPETERAAATILSLPMFPQMTDPQVSRVIAAVTACCTMA